MPLAAWSRTLPAKAATSRPGTARVPAAHLACSQPCHRAQGTERTSCSREAPGIVTGATVLPRAVSRVAHDHADELPEVNRALPGSWAAQKGRLPSASPVN